MAIVNSINLIDDYGQNLLRYYNNDMSSHDCETLFQTEITKKQKRKKYSKRK